MKTVSVLAPLIIFLASGMGSESLAYANEYGRIVDQCDQEEKAARRSGDYSFNRDTCASCRERERTDGFYEGVREDSPCARFVSPSSRRESSSSRDGGSQYGSSSSRHSGGGESEGSGPRRMLRDDSCLTTTVDGPHLGHVFINFNNQCGESIEIEGSCESAGGLRPVSDRDRTTAIPGRSQITCYAR